MSGLLLASAYAPNISDSFYLVTKIIDNVSEAWWVRYLHANGASLFFVCLYLHIGRGIYFNSFLLTHTWRVGVTIFFLTMAAAFLGYVLPVNQISFWGASVITNLAREVPYLGRSILRFIWGGVAVQDPTVKRFFIFHFILPFIILALVGLHITFLHTTGSSNPLGLATNKKIKFQYKFSSKDLLGVLLVITLFVVLCTHYPLILGDDDNFANARAAVTPQHIQPEWYFLFAYAILRSIPNKFGGVVALVMSIAILYTIPFTYLGVNKSKASQILDKIIYWFLIVTVLLLTWIGARSVEDPYIVTGQILTITYFSYYLIKQPLIKICDKLIL